MAKISFVGDKRTPRMVVAWPRQPQVLFFRRFHLIFDFNANREG